MADPRPAPIENASTGKELRLVEWLRARGSALLGFSGGVDSAYLASVAQEALGERLLAVIGRSASYPEEQWRVARDVAAHIGLRIVEVDTDELADERYAANPTNRCYFCKGELWNKLTRIARDAKLAVVIDGTNADDVQGHRPGMRAAAEYGVLSPLVDVGFTKDEIRQRSRARALPTWSRPSAPCLSSRVQYGIRVTSMRLHQVEGAERALRDLGIEGDLRVRHHGDLARVELSADILNDWLQPTRTQAIARALRAHGFARVTLDLRGFRSGSLNILREVPAA
jgi:uncharacterized protein